MNRIENLRKAALNRVTTSKNPGSEEFFYRFFKVYDETNYDEAYYNALSKLNPVISDGELIVGRFSGALSEEEKKEWDEVYFKKAVERQRMSGGGQDSHMAVDYDLLLSEGTEGILKKIEGKDTPFYNSCRNALNAVAAHSESYAAEAERLARETADEARKAELVEIARICRRVPMKPAESFYEAVQSVNFITYCLSMNPHRFCHQLFQLGRPDQYLYPFYEKDIKEGKITKEFAQLLLDCFGIQINMRVPNGLSCGYMVGGRNPKGEIVQNELTLMLMQVVDDIRLVYPAVGLCLTKGMDEKYLKKACEILSRGRSHPAIFNDDIITKGLIGYGVPESEAHSYIHSACVEITPVASSNVWVASPYTNMVQILLNNMNREYASFDELLSKIFNDLDKSIKFNCDDMNKRRGIRAENCINPLTSCFVNDCLDRGVDLEKGGGRYNWITPSFVGVANLVDSLYVIKEVVFDKKEFTMAELKKITDSNFEGFEELRLRFLNSIPKYGNDNDDVDKYFGMITDHIIKECKKHECVYTNGKLIPSVFCWIKHEMFGRETGATPDGRLAGFPLGDGSGPCQGREMNGPTASVISSTKWEHHELIGGVAVNMKFSKKSLGASSVDTMVGIVKTYLDRGGFEMQINVVDEETLKDAVKEPEKYKDLIVRIGGYSDYFTRLSPQMQQEVILRTTHNI